MLHRILKYLLLYFTVLIQNKHAILILNPDYEYTKYLEVTDCFKGKCRLLWINCLISK